MLKIDFLCVTTSLSADPMICVVCVSVPMRRSKLLILLIKIGSHIHGDEKFYIHVISDDAIDPLRCGALVLRCGL